MSDKDMSDQGLSTDLPDEVSVGEAVEAANAAPRPNHFWLDFGPLLVFFGTFHWIRRSNPDDALFIAAAVFAVAALIALAFGWLKYRTVSFVLIFSTLVIVGTTALAFFFDNKVFLFMRPTAVNGLMGLGVLGGVLFGKNVLRLLLGGTFALTDRAWTILAIRWGLFFLCIALINEIVWRTQTESFWVNFKTFGFLPMTLVFAFAQLPFIQRHGGLVETADDAA
ncbi:inner membrane-spanning protein YciB [Algimonas porphyrae]|uniref:Inner membrane-spanning protein YciB n=1 Tax=Algimonas porphyrae TaxID=1128113 RepID=A0ABQ5V1Y4_9PROT|nr:septation protein IspZ [Algimonas porphyrae]GLQ20601.1 putative intracellular septation protein A [Algimonas porphyrae]